MINKTQILDEYTPTFAILNMSLCVFWVLASFFGLFKPSHVLVGDWFSSSGAVLTISSAFSEFMISRWALKFKKENIEVGNSYIRTTQVKQVSTKNIERFAFCFMAIGTFIWAYGAYLIE